MATAGEMELMKVKMELNKAKESIARFKKELEIKEAVNIEIEEVIPFSNPSEGIWSSI